MKHYLVFLCLLFCFLPAESQVASNDPATARSKLLDGNVNEEDLVHLGDVVDVDLVGGFEFDWRGTLTPEGFLDGLEGTDEPVFALCRTEAAIAADIARIYSRTLRDPQIKVRIVDRSNRAVVRLEGAVRTPARFRLRRSATLRELIILAGGMTDGASGDITILRPKDLSCGAASASKGPNDKSRPDNGPETINIKISELLSGNISANPTILSGDFVTVVRALPVYVIGAVNNPKPIYTRAEITVSRAIAAAGGLSKDAEGGRVTIFRREGGESRVIVLDLGKIKRGESVDEVLKPFDILDVASKGGGERKFPPVAAGYDKNERNRGEIPLRVVD
jgi:protein involved in polysaccharide export with SLBB domain